jgi:glycosyltransferase involved in cell wall biosynthesis
MFKININIIFIILFIYFLKKIFKSDKEHFSTSPFRLKILVPFYNPGAKLFKRCMKTIENQNNNNYDVCMIDDASTKETDELHKIMDYYTNKYDNYHSIKKKDNLGTLHSNIMAMNKLECNDDDVVIIVDGDDSLYGENAFKIIENTYLNNDVHVTFGNYYRRYKGEIDYKKNVDCNRDYATIRRNHSYRDMNVWFGFSHIKTFKYKLFKSVPHNYFKDKDGTYFKSSTDVATMLSVLERSGGKFKCIEEPIYVYTSDHPNSHHNNNKTLNKQKKNELYIRTLEKLQPL